MNIGGTTTWLVTSRAKMPVASFEERAAADLFIDTRQGRGVLLRLFKQEIIVTEVIPD